MQPSTGGRTDTRTQALKHTRIHTHTHTPTRTHEHTPYAFAVARTERMCSMLASTMTVRLRR